MKNTKIWEEGKMRKNLTLLLLIFSALVFAFADDNEFEKFKKMQNLRVLTAIGKR